MKKYTFLIVTVIALFFYACKKKTARYMITGTVYDMSLHQALKNTDVYLYRVPAGSTKEELLASTSIKEDGTYYFTIDRDKSTEYVIRIEKQNYFPIEGRINVNNLVLNGESKFDFNTTAKSWVRLHFKNLYGNANTELTYTKQDGKQDCLECCTKSEVSLKGLIDTNIYCINDGDKDYSYVYYVTGTTNHGVKTIKTIPFDTVTLNLWY